jgi:hypothetical protein
MFPFMLYKHFLKYNILQFVTGNKLDGVWLSFFFYATIFCMCSKPVLCIKFPSTLTVLFGAFAPDHLPCFTYIRDQHIAEPPNWEDYSDGQGEQQSYPYVTFWPTAA